MKKKGKRLAALAVSFLVGLLLTGCMMTSSAEELYVLPKLPEEYQSLRARIQTILADGAEYAAPTAGTNLQSVQLVDLDGDGEEEALAFFRNSSTEKPLKIYVFRAKGGVYEELAIIEGSGTAINSVRYVDMDADGCREILVSWRVSAEVQAMAVYAMEDLSSPLMASAYARYDVVDLDNDQILELIVLRSDGTESGGSVADYYDWIGQTLIQQSAAKLSMTVAELQWMQAGTLRDGCPAIFVTGVEAEARTITDILVYKEPELVNIVLNSATGASSEIFRNLSLQPSDINTDGVTEVPMPAELIPDGEESYWKVYWRSYNSSGAAEMEAVTYHNSADSWYLLLPREWDGHFAVRQKNISAAERATTFYSLRGRQLGEELFTIYTLTGANRENLAAGSSREILRRQPSGAVYAVTYYDTYPDWRYAVSKEELAGRFNAIVTQWTTGDN